MLTRPWNESVWLIETPWTVSCQAPLAIEFSRQEHWRGTIPFPGDLPNPGIEPSLQSCGLFSHWNVCVYLYIWHIAWSWNTLLKHQESISHSKGLPRHYAEFTKLVAIPDDGCSPTSIWRSYILREYFFEKVCPLQKEELHGPFLHPPNSKLKYIFFIWLLWRE